MHFHQVHKTGLFVFRNFCTKTKQYELNLIVNCLGIIKKNILGIRNEKNRRTYINIEQKYMIKSPITP